MIRKLMAVSLAASILIIGCGKSNDVRTDSSRIADNTPVNDVKLQHKAVKKDDNSKENSQGANFEKPVFKLKNWDKDVKKPEVEDDSSNVTKEALGDEGKEDENGEMRAPEGSLANSLQNRGEKIIWIPKWHFEGVGGVKLPGICVSPDSSVMAIIETTGSEKGPNGSRIVLLDTYCWSVLRVHEFQENKFTRISFLSDGTGIAIWSEKQPMIKKPFELLSIGISKGEVKSASKEIKTEISSLTAIPGKVLVKTSDDNFIFCFESSDLSRQPVKVEGEIQGGIFAVSQDGATVALAGEKGIETYDSAGMQLLKKINNDGHMIPDNAVFTGKNGWIAISACSKPGYIFKDGQKKEFCDMTGKAIMFNADGNILAFEKYLNSEIVLIEFPELAEIGKWTPSGMKPKTQGSAVFMAYLKHLGKYAVLDSYGNLCLYSKPAKSVKWSKKLIFSSKK